MENSNERMIHHWILQHCCKSIWNIFINPNSYEDPDKEVYSYFDIIYGALQVFQSEDWDLERRETDWLCLAEFCFKCHTSTFDEADDGTDENHVGLFHTKLIELFDRHGVSSEKVSQVVNIFNKTQKVKGMMLNSRSLNQRIKKADRKFLNDVKVITKEAGVKLGPSFLEQLVSSILNCTTNQLTFSDLVDVVDEHVEQSSDLKRDGFEETQTVESKTSQNKRGAKKLYNPSRIFNLTDLPSNSANARENPSPVKTKATTTSASLLPGTATRSSPRLSARKLSTPGHSSVSARKHFDMQGKSSVSCRSAFGDGKGPDKEASNFTLNAQSKQATGTSNSPPRQCSPFTKKRLNYSRYELRSAQKQSEFTSDSRDAVNEGSDSDSSIDLHICTDSEAESNPSAYAVNAGNGVVAIFSDSEDSNLDSHNEMDDVTESSPNRRSSLEGGQSAENHDEADESMEIDSFAYATDSNENNIRQLRPRKRKSEESQESRVGYKESQSKRGGRKLDFCSDQNQVPEGSSLSVARNILTDQNQVPEGSTLSVPRNILTDQYENNDETNKLSATTEKTRRTARSPSPSSDDSIVEEANLPKFDVKQQKRRFFTQEEEEWLRKGVSRFGIGKWKSILAYYPFEGRSTVNLKDKWRNLVNAGLT